MGVNAGIVEKAGTWYLHKEDRLGQGRDAARGFLKENPSVADAIERAVRAKYMPGEAALVEKPEPKPEAKPKERETAKAGRAKD